jgi:hypothetical protein
MRLLLVVALCAVAAVVAPAPPEARAAPAKCVSPTFRGVWYRPWTLRTTWIRVGARVGTAEFYRGNAPNCRKEVERVHRISGISPAVAVAVGGSSRRLLIRDGVCDWPEADEAWLVRCLRRASG